MFIEKAEIPISKLNLHKFYVLSKKLVINEQADSHKQYFTFLKEELIELVGTMSPAEKRLFKLTITPYRKDAKISQLFDCYVGVKTLEQLKKRMTKEFSTKRVEKMHSELYQKLLVFMAEQEIKSKKHF